MSATNDHLSPEDRRLLEEMRDEAAANREHNRAAMDAAGVPQAARRGFSRATCWNQYRIAEIQEHPYEGRASRWSVIVELYPGSFTRNGYIVGPRGKATRAF